MENLTTTIKWHFVKEKLPKESGEYLIALDYGDIMTINFSKKFKRFNVTDYARDEEWAEKVAIKNVVCWAEIPSCFLDENIKNIREGKNNE